jgi:hypothetical protein
MELSVQNPYTVRYNQNKDSSVNSYIISADLAGSYDIKLNTGITGPDVAVLLMLLAQIVQELDRSDEHGTSTSMHSENMTNSIKMLTDTIKALESPTNVGKAISSNHQKIVQIGKQILSEVKNGMNQSNHSQLEDMGRQAGSTLVHRIIGNYDKMNSKRKRTSREMSKNDGLQRTV